MAAVGRLDSPQLNHEEEVRIDWDSHRVPVTIRRPWQVWQDDLDILPADAAATIPTPTMAATGWGAAVAQIFPGNMGASRFFPSIRPP